MFSVYSNRSFYRGSIILSYTVWMWDLGNLGYLLMKRFRNRTWGTKSPNIFSTKYLNRIQDVVKMKKWFEDDMEFVTRPTAWDSSPTLKHLPGKPQDQKEFTTSQLHVLNNWEFSPETKTAKWLPPTSSSHPSASTNLPGLSAPISLGYSIQIKASRSIISDFARAWKLAVSGPTSYEVTGMGPPEMNEKESVTRG